MMPTAANPDYSAAKAAMIAMSASLAKAVAAEGVTVNTVSPGTVAAERGIAPDAPWEEGEGVVLALFAKVPVGVRRNAGGNRGCHLLPCEPSSSLYNGIEHPTGRWNASDCLGQ